MAEKTETVEPFNAPVIVDAHGKPARRPKGALCPRCGATSDKRVASSGFGVAHPVCPCGYEFFDEVWRG